MDRARRRSLRLLCQDCGKYWADYPSKRCPGCERTGSTQAMSDQTRVEERLRKLAALAINELNGGTIFDVKVDGALLCELAIKEGLFLLDELHHAPACPANHYHKQRLPTGRCTCGAANHEAGGGHDRTRL